MTLSLNNSSIHLFLTSVPSLPPSSLQFASKQMARSAKKCEKEEKAEKVKLKKALQKGNVEGARIHAENAIRQKNQVLRWRGHPRIFVPL